MTGITSASAIHMVNVDDATFGWNVANAVQVAHQHAKPGDVILIEQQIAGPDGAFVPLEWDPATYDAIVSAVADGVIVVETAGNGGANLDNASLYGSPFPLGKPDSGAIIVGAGAGCPGQTARSRLAFSDYGARVDLQGWGNCVATTGWDGNLTPGASLDHSYTNDFSGTSSAGPIVASSAAALTSALIKTTGSVPSARAVRRDLVQYGTPQAFTAGTQGQSIGPLPNMAATLEAVLAPSVFFEPFANLAAWSPTVKGVSLESIRTVSPGFAAQAVSKGAGAGYAVHSQTLSGTGVYVRSKVYVVSQGSTSATLLKVRNSANGGIAYLYRTAAGYLAARRGQEHQQGVHHQAFGRRLARPSTAPGHRQLVLDRGVAGRQEDLRAQLDRRTRTGRPDQAPDRRRLDQAHLQGRFRRHRHLAPLHRTVDGGQALIYGNDVGIGVDPEHGSR